MNRPRLSPWIIGGLAAAACMMLFAAHGFAADAPATAAPANRRRDATVSARLSIALVAVPVTNPSCVTVVSHPTCDADSDHEAATIGPIALPISHSDMPSSSATARHARVRHAAAECSGGCVVTVRI